MGSGLFYQQGRDGRGAVTRCSGWTSRLRGVGPDFSVAPPPRGQAALTSVPVLPAAEANAISETTETLHLSPQVAPEYAGPGAPRRPEVCERSCEELGTMITELSGLHVMVNQLHENLRTVVGARPAASPRGRARQGDRAGGGGDSESEAHGLHALRTVLNPGALMSPADTASEGEGGAFVERMGEARAGRGALGGEDTGRMRTARSPALWGGSSVPGDRSQLPLRHALRWAQGTGTGRETRGGQAWRVCRSGVSSLLRPGQRRSAGVARSHPLPHRKGPGAMF